MSTIYLNKNKAGVKVQKAWIIRFGRISVPEREKRINNLKLKGSRNKIIKIFPNYIFEQNTEES